MKLKWNLDGKGHKEIPKEHKKFALAKLFEFKKDVVKMFFGTLFAVLGLAFLMNDLTIDVVKEAILYQVYAGVFALILIKVAV